MTISFLLNGTAVSLDVAPNKRLIDVLREDFNLQGNRAGCYSGTCGTCAVLINAELSYSCLVPVFAIQDTEVLTCEGLEEAPEFKDIIDGFKTAEYQPCANCRQSRLLSAYALLSSHPNPERKIINEYLANHQCGCSSTAALYDAIEKSAFFRRSRRHAR
jgi:aerobic carbon-monoxide dehydrogenase small subunit